MRYYVTADPHGFYTLMRGALEDAGYFSDPEPHKLIICGDAMDRGDEPVEMQNFLVGELEAGRLIMIRGNHEDLLGELADGWFVERDNVMWGISHHNHNGTDDTAYKLTGFTPAQAFAATDAFPAAIRNTAFMSKIVPASLDYFETEHYIFVHGWIPTSADSYHRVYKPGWREASTEDWSAARWVNGMQLAVEFGIVEPGKTIVCGHWHTSYGHYKYEASHTPEFSDGADFSPFYSDGIIALDACTAASGRVNCIILED